MTWLEDARDLQTAIQMTRIDDNNMEEKRYSHKAQYYETDQMGIVHHSNYIRWFEEARTAFLSDIGFNYKKLEEMGIISPVLSIECQYKKMTYFEDEVYISVHVKSFNGVKLFVSYEIKGAVDDSIRVTGETSHCFLDKNGMPIRMKRMYPDFYEALSSRVEN